MSAEKLTLEKLETWLWDSADIMRGSIDSSDFKNYIFGLIFLKRLNDVFLERIDQEMEKEGCSKEEAIAIIEEDYANEFVPVDARWDNIIKKTENIGESIDEAFAEIEAQNPDLERVLTAIKFGDKERLSNDLLQRLLRHFNKHKLGNNNLYKADMLGDAYEYLIAQFADDAGKKGGEFYTPHGVVELIVKLIDPQPGHEIYDPTFGCGGMLVESARHIAEKPNGMRFGKPNCVLYGQERNLGTWAIGKLNLFLHNMTAKLERGDTLVDPKHKDGNSILSFDRVIANPPFSALDWWTPLEANKQTKTDKNGNVKEVPPKYNKELKDPYGRFSYGIAPRKKADFAFVQHMVASLKEDGRMGVVVPHGVLFREGDDGKIRKAMLKGVNDFKGDLIEGIIGLPTGLFYNTGIAAAIILINKSKPAALKDKVVFIDASAEFKEGKNQNSLRECDIKNITNRFNQAVTKLVDAGETTQEQLTSVLDDIEIEKYLRIVDMDEIEKNNFNLNISRYIDTTEPEEIIDVETVKKELQEIESEIDLADKELEKQLSSINFNIEQHMSLDVNRDIPEGWIVKNVEDIADIKTGTGDTQDREENGKYPFYVRSNKIERVNHYSFEGEGVLTSGDGVGVGKIYHYVNGKIHYHQRVYNIHNFKKGVSGRYFYEFFRRNFYNRVMRMSAKGSVDSVRLEMIAKMPILIPPQEEQDKIADILGAISKKVELLERLKDEHNKYNLGLMQKLLTGTWRVKSDKAENSQLNA